MGTSTNYQQQRAIIYLRGSSRLAIQYKECMRIAARYGLTVVREYVDIGRPARLDQQIEMLRLLGDLHQWRDVGYVVVWDYATLAREAEQLKQIFHHVHACRGHILTVTDTEAAQQLLENGKPEGR